MQVELVKNNLTATAPILHSQLLQPNAEILAEQIKERRIKIFFTPIELENTILDDNINTSINIEKNVFYNGIKTTDCLKLKKIFIQQVEEFIKIDKYFCGDRHLDASEKLINRIKKESIENTAFIQLNFSNISYWMHEIIIILKKFKSQLDQQDENTTDIILNKDAIALRLDESVVDFNKCWPGICGRLSREYEIFCCFNQGIAGKINIIKKDLSNEIIITYLNRLKKENSHVSFTAGDENHIGNFLSNLIKETLGTHQTVDSLESDILGKEIKDQFIELVKIEISPAQITSVLASNLHKELTIILTNIAMGDWLTNDKTDDQLTENISTLDTKFFDPMNALLKAPTENELNLQRILYTTIEEDTKYSLKSSKEKIHHWVAQCLMPNTEKVFVTNIANNLTIKSIDDMFFWVTDSSYETDNNFNANEHITLQLPHIQQLDFINFTDVDQTNNTWLSDDIKKTEVSITLVTQAMEQTQDAKAIVNFLTDDNVYIMLNKLPLLQDKINIFINNKLLNKSFEQQFIHETTNYYLSNYKPSSIQRNECSINKLCCLLNNNICINVLAKIIKQNIIIDDFIDKIDIKYLAKISIDLLSTVPDATRELLFNKALNHNSCELMYKLLQTKYCNTYINYKSKNNKETPFSLAVEYKHIQLVELLLQYKDLYLDLDLDLGNYYLFNDFFKGNHKISGLWIKHILDNKEKFTDNHFIQHLQAKNLNGCPGLHVALAQGYDKVVKEYLTLILNSDKLTSKQKLKIIQAQDIDGCPGLHVAFKQGHDKAVKEYITLILNSNEFSSEEKLELIQAKDLYKTPGLHEAFVNDNDKAVKECIALILNSGKLTSRQKLKIIQARNKKSIPGLYRALKKGQDKAAQECITLMLNSDAFTSEKKVEIIQAIRLKYSNFSGLWPWLYMALAKGYDEKIKEYIPFILNIDKLTSEQKLQIIQAKDRDGTPGLHIALYAGNDKAVKEYMTLILNSDAFTSEQILELIKAESEDDDSPGLYRALKNGHDKAVEEYLTLILNSDAFTIEQKLEIIQVKKSKNKNISGLDIALKNDRNETVGVYFNVISVSKKLTIQQKKIVFADIKTKNFNFYTILVTNSSLTVAEKNYLLERANVS